MKRSRDSIFFLSGTKGDDPTTGHCHNLKNDHLDNAGGIDCLDGLGGGN